MTASVDCWGQSAPPDPEPRPPAPPRGCSLKLRHADEPATTRKRDYVVRGVIDAGALAVLYGAPKAGKSFVALDIACRVARGWDVLGRRVNAGATLYVALEGNLDDRLAAFRSHHGVDDAPAVTIATGGLDLTGPADAVAAYLIAQIEDASRHWNKPVRLVVIDTMFRAMGGADPNEARAINGLTAAIDRVREATEAAVLIVHHAAKANDETPLGSIAVLANVDASLLVRRDKVSGVGSVIAQDLRDHESGWTFSFSLHSVQVGEDADGEPRFSRVVVAANDEGGASPRKRREPGGD